MVGIILTLLAVLLVICLAFCYSDHTQFSRHPAKDLPFLDRTHRKKN